MVEAKPPIGWNVSSNNTTEVQKGKKLLLAAIILYLGISFLSIAGDTIAAIPTASHSEFLTDLILHTIRFALECGLFVFIYLGHTWARILALVFFGIGLAIILFLIFSFTSVPLNMIMMIGLFIVYLYVFVILLSKPVKQYLDYAKSNRF